MKKITRMKLINWHYITDSTIDFNGSSLITGDNGSGKSTILDALQYVLTGGKSKFNNAAHDKANRDLIGYVRCKTGKDSKQYERTGDVTAHVAIEFYEEKKKKSFILGVVIDSSSDLNIPKHLFYRIENKKISDELFLRGNTPRNISDFKVNIKSFEHRLLNTIQETQRDFGHRYGALNNRFFELLPKALAFKPIDNVKDFVYSYILDTKEVNIEYLKENVRTYLEFDKILQDIKNKLVRLTKIDLIYNELLRISENIRVQEYIILRASKEIEENKLENKIKEEKNSSDSYKKGMSKELAQREELDRDKSIADELHTSLLKNDTYQMINSLKNQINDLNNEYGRIVLREKEFDQNLAKEIDRSKKLYNQSIVVKGIEEFISSSKDLMNLATISSFSKASINIEHEYKAMNDELVNKRAELKIKKTSEVSKLSDIEKDIRLLESKKLVYGENILLLQNDISLGIKNELGKDIEPKIICELLHIKDPSWRNAVEGYMNTQRFNLIVDPQYFDIALSIYERVKSNKNIHSVGLLNTQKLDAFDTCAQDSLAYLVTSNNKYAKQYINMILGKVIRCDKVEDLKKFQRAITDTCMVYQNNTARQISPDIYKKPYIGEDAYKEQLKQKIVERDECTLKITEISKKIDILDSTVNLLSGLRLEYLRENCGIKLEANDKSNELKDKNQQLERIDKSSLIQLQFELDRIIDKNSKAVKQLELVVRENIKLSVKIENLNKEISLYEEISAEATGIFTVFEEKNMDIIARAEDKFKDSTKVRDLESIRTSFFSSKKGYETQKDKKNNELSEAQRDYNRDFHFGAAEGTSGMKSFQNEYRLLKDSKVIEYEEKIKVSRQKAEEQFKEHFVSKLQENILSAQGEFKKLNNALKGITFGEDEYKFQYMESKDNKKFYNMIMDDTNFGGFTLFTSSFMDKHKEAIDELFERITIDDEESQKTLEKFTDYRTYMDYDIKIHHLDGSTSSFSKVCREKSGGETQTPYYVAIAASFVQLYDGTHQDESIGVILFDEAFDKMDENRIESMMSFLNKLNLQVIIAAPPQKIESIAGHVGTTLVISREDTFSWVEALYINEKL
ncbi:AAA family ATPase [Clostridium estertheticum]|uniref:ATP-binding protein n=1 Tax=Clostridium estertheticum TaxID=238834 RepID=UPI001C0DA4C2|nr:SbcC/MukB-like Walker B domain-containing protein [Clostridium estertheticum]MBU3178410.1 AAA family ATPase [Clostridium estertheticum]